MLKKEGIVHFWDLSNNYVILNPKLKNKLMKEFIKIVKTRYNANKILKIPRSALSSYINKNKPRIKTSEEKLTYPGKKQVYRIYDKYGMFKEDILSLEDESPSSNSEGLLIPIMKNGEMVVNLPNIDEIQDFYLNNIKRLPESYKKLEDTQIFNLKISKKLQDLTNILKLKYS